MNFSALEAIQSHTLDVLREALGGATRVALVDFPNHENSGDSLIFLGEVAYLKQLDVHIDYVTDYGRYDKETLNSLSPEGPILLHGGGNFGDRWLELQQGRERVIEDFPERQIIQLPQTVDFSEGELLLRAQRVLSRHPNLTILIRDHAGVDRTRELFPSARTIFCPDMAFGYGQIVPRRKPNVNVVVLKRGDLESIQGALVSPDPRRTQKTEDWGLTGLRRLIFIALHIPGAVAKRIPKLRKPLSPILGKCYTMMAKINVANAVDILSQGTLVVTDRLHATVLAALMDKQVIAFDNANGKISAIINDYLGSMPTVKYCANPSEARRLISEMFPAEA